MSVGAADEPDAEGFSYRITVHGEAALRQARWDAVVALKRQGWEPVERGARTVFKPPRRWMGRAVLDGDGTLSFRYPVVRVRDIEAQPSTTSLEPIPTLQRQPAGMVLPDGSADRQVVRPPAPVFGMWLLPSRRVLDTAYARTRSAVEPELEQLRRVQRDTRVQRRVQTLAAELDLLWTSGIPLDNGEPLPTEQARAEAVLMLWATRPDDFEGRQLTLAIERWVRNVLYDVYTVDEPTRRRFEALRSDGRALPPTGAGDDASQPSR